jgi:putative tricarboxylic transport membrane protein
VTAAEPGAQSADHEAVAPRRPDRAGLAIAAILAGLAALVAWDAYSMRVAATYARVGPATVPYVVAAILLALAAGTVVAAVRGSFPVRERQELGPLAWIVGGLAAQMLLLTTAGFSIATGLLFAATARGFGQRPLWLSFLVGTGLAYAAWIAFAVGLRLSLPAGPLERLLF